MKSAKINKYVFFVALVFFMGTLFPYAYSAVDSGLKQLRTFIDTMEYIRDNYVEQTDSDKLIHGAIKGVVAELDDFSQYLEPKDYKALKNDTRGDFGGLGVRLVKTDGFVTVVTPMPGTPAFKAKVMPGDRILFVDDRDISEMDLDDVVELMRGPAGSKVKVTMSRKDEATGEYKKLPDFNFKREKIVPEVAHYRMLPGKIGYLYLIDFSGHTSEEVKKALSALQKQGMESLILDLRFNPGGLLQGAADVSKMFLDQNKMIVFTKGRKQEFYQEIKSGATAPFPDIPMVALVNQGSASASEIVAGALQDHKRAVVVGRRTFGKASVQQVMPLNDGAGLRLTIARYYTPSGRLIQRDYRTKDEEKEKEGGIIPDIEIKVEPQEEIKVFLQYNSIIHTPGQETKPIEFKENDPVLDKAVEILTQGPVTAEEAKKEEVKQK